MGYTTEFRGSFKLNKPVDAETRKLLDGLAKTRRMARNIEGYGVEGEFFVNRVGFAGHSNSPDVIDQNRPPKTQPGLWLQWVLNEDGTEIGWDGGEKFYNYIEWIEYLIKAILAPRGYVLKGVIQWRGEEWDDTGAISIVNNKVTIR